jgi:hypothetical protein
LSGIAFFAQYKNEMFRKRSSYRRNIVETVGTPKLCGREKFAFTRQVFDPCTAHQPISKKKGHLAVAFFYGLRAPIPDSSLGSHRSVARPPPGRRVRDCTQPS